MENAPLLLLLLSCPLWPPQDRNSGCASKRPIKGQLSKPAPVQGCASQECSTPAEGENGSRKAGLHGHSAVSAVTCPAPLTAGSGPHSCAQRSWPPALRRTQRPRARPRLAQPRGSCDEDVHAPRAVPFKPPELPCSPVGTTVSFTDGETRRLVSGAAGPKPRASDPEPADICPFWSWPARRWTWAVNGGGSAEESPGSHPGPGLSNGNRTRAPNASHTGNCRCSGGFMKTKLKKKHNTPGGIHSNNICI